MTSGPLQGLRVLSLAEQYPGPYATLLLADLGADVVLVERPPGLVYVSISGFGQEGPYRLRPAHDVSYQAVAGFLADWTGGPPGASPSPALGDLSSGMFAVIGTLAALQARERTGRGSYVDLSMTDGLVSMLTAHLVPVINRLGPPAFPTEPGYGVYRTADGHRLALSVAHEDRFWAALCAALALPHLRDLPHVPALGEHTRQVLCEIGYDEEAIDRLVDGGAVDDAAAATSPAHYAAKPTSR